MINYLFLPDKIKELLEKYPTIQGKIESPDKEGTKSESYSQARKSERQIYRILSTQHYPHHPAPLDRATNILQIGV